ncbi:MAG: hypothetical protein IJH65_03395 [Methanobrevibacter sp.]|nr:hypothetical protein [Methanobrevibacter sp.]
MSKVDVAKEDLYRHTHCIICGEYKDLSDGTSYHNYICDECMNSFPIDYIMFRIKCWKDGIWLKQFNNLEWRLSGRRLEKEDLYEDEYTWNWGDEPDTDEE